MRIAEALRWFGAGEQLAWRALRAGKLGKAGLRPAVGAFVRPLTAPSRYPEYGVVFELLHGGGIDLEDPSSWLLDIGSPKLFSLLLAARTRATVVATDIWQPAIDEADALCGGLAAEVAARVRLGIADAREPLPAALLPPGGRFAAAFSMSVIEHIEPDPGGDRRALDRMADVVRTAGAVAVRVPPGRGLRPAPGRRSRRVLPAGLRHAHARGARRRAVTPAGARPLRDLRVARSPDPAAPAAVPGRGRLRRGQLPAARRPVRRHAAAAVDPRDPPRRRCDPAVHADRSAVTAGGAACAAWTRLASGAHTRPTARDASTPYTKCTTANASTPAARSAAVVPAA